VDVLRQMGVTVWYDESELKIGDNLRRRIDDGLTNCRYGVVLLSQSFFAKHYTNQELDGLAQREVDGVKVLLPVWVRVDEVDVRRYSPALAGRIAARWDDGLYVVASKIIAEVRPDILEAMAKDRAMAQLRRIRNGEELSAIFTGEMGIYPFNDTLRTQQEVELIGGFLQLVNDWAELWDDIEIGRRVEVQFELTNSIDELGREGWTVYGGKVRGRYREFSDLRAYALAVLRGHPLEVSFRNGSLEVLRASGASTQRQAPA